MFENLREVNYKCGRCGKVSTLRFAKDYVAFRRWLMTCRSCGKYALHNATNRGQLTQAGWR